jgi:hypothetical protein
MDTVAVTEALQEETWEATVAEDTEKTLVEEEEDHAVVDHTRTTKV